MNTPISSSNESRFAKPAALDRRLWAVLSIAVGAQTAGSVVAQGVYVLVPFWRDALGVSLAAASLAVTVMNGAQIVTMFSLGRAIDRHGERLVVSLAMLGMGLAMALAAMFARGLPSLLLAMVLLGGTYAAVQPGGTRAILRWFPPQHRGLATGFRQAAVPCGTMIAAAILPFLAVRYGLEGALWFCAAVSVSGALLFWALYREGAASLNSATQPMNLKVLVPKLGQNPVFWPVLRLGIAMSAFQFTLTAHIIGFLSDRLALPLVLGATLFAGAQLAGIPGRVLLPWLIDRHRPGRRAQSFAVVSIVGALAAAGLAFLPPGANVVLIGILLTMLGFFGIGWFPIFILEIAESAPNSSIASTVAFSTTLCMTVMALGPFLFGVVVDRFGYGIAWAALLAPVFLTAVPILIPRRDRDVRNAKS